jgi:glycosyltransferase involved in cell wall biosynthesis
MARVADRVITVSEFSARELHRAFGVPDDRIHVIPHGIDTDRFHPATDGDAELIGPLGLPERFVLFLGSLDPRKNIPLLAEATAELGVELVLAGVPCVGSEQIRGPHVRSLGPVGSELVAPLLRIAAVLAFPSSHEGFGLPVVEAMACGTPVVISDRGALPEVAGGAAEVVTDLTGPRELAAALHAVLSDDGHAGDLRERGLVNAARYRWERSALSHRDVFAGLAR